MIVTWYVLHFDEDQRYILQRFIIKRVLVNLVQDHQNEEGSLIMLKDSTREMIILV